MLILAFWATWCVPCKAELAELNRFWSRVEENPHVALLTVSIDDTMTAVAEFATQNGYRVPILKSDGTIESAYTNGKAVGADGAQIPQLYILDAMGNVRFHLTGFGNDGLFVQKLGWMIAAALK